MNDKILSALLQLDTNNDDHWTSDGLPRMDAVEAIVGNKGITRQQVTAAKPGFSRAVAAQAPAPAQAPQVQGGEGNGDPADKSAPAPAQATGDGDTGGDAAGEAQQQEMEGELVSESETRQALGQAKAELQELAKARNEAVQAYEAKVQEVDALNDQLIAEEGVETPTEAIQGYLAKQRELLADRAQRMKAIKESGVNLADLQRGLKSPLDVALKGRR